MVEYHTAVGVSHLQRERGSILEGSEMITGKTMAQSVIRPICDAGGSAGGLELFAEIVWSDLAAVLTEGQQPLPQVRLHLHEAMPCRLGLGCRHLDQAVVEIHL